VTDKLNNYFQSLFFIFWQKKKKDGVYALRC
jgi:hypothetical protein